MTEPTDREDLPLAEGDPASDAAEGTDEEAQALPRPRRGPSRRTVYGLVAGLLVLAVLAARFTLDEQAQTGPTIGGPFTLVDTEGRTLTEADFQGRFMLVYFGYTFCPDICPTALTTMADALDLLGEAGLGVVPVFVTVDPERDTPEHLADYVTHFHSRQVGLSGSPAQLAAAAGAYKVYYAKVQEDGADADDYLMDHTSVIYLMGPDGRYRAHFTHGTEADAMAARIREFL
jgi:protein SCO1/2